MKSTNENLISKVKRISVSGNEAVTRTRQLNSAQLNATFKSNAEPFFNSSRLKFSAH